MFLWLRGQQNTKAAQLLLDFLENRSEDDTEQDIC